MADSDYLVCVTRNYGSTFARYPRRSVASWSGDEATLGMCWGMCTVWQAESLRAGRMLFPAGISYRRRNARLLRLMRPTQFAQSRQLIDFFEWKAQIAQSRFIRMSNASYRVAMGGADQDVAAMGRLWSTTRDSVTKKGYADHGLTVTNLSTMVFSWSSNRFAHFLCDNILNGRCGTDRRYFGVDIPQHTAAFYLDGDKLFYFEGNRGIYAFDSFTRESPDVLQAFVGMISRLYGTAFPKIYRSNYNATTRRPNFEELVTLYEVSVTP